MREAEAEAEASSSSRTKSDVKIKTQRTEFTLINDDALHNILARLPASSFASAACVSKSWNQVCNRILSRPKLASALSLNPSTPIAVEEVLDKVLREPIRPHFVIATIGNGFGLIEAYQLITKRLGSSTPFIISIANGIIGRDALNNEFREVKWGDFGGVSEDEVGGYIEEHGIVLTVGFVPGLKVDAIPLLSTVKERQVPLIDKFVKDVKDYTASVSVCTSPVGIIMFGGGLVDMNPFIDSLDHALPRETVIVGDERGCFLYRSGNETRNVCGSKKYSSVAVGIGDIQFHVALSNGVSAVGPIYKAASVRVNKHDHNTWLTARREGDRDILDGEIILDDINDELENDIESPDLYIGVTKRRKCRIESKEKRWITSLVFHGVIDLAINRGDEEYLYVSGVNIKTGDYFQFYHSDPNIALSSCSDASVNLKNLKLDGSDTRTVAVSIKKEVFGGFIFSCCGRGESFFGRRNVDSSPFTENFPGVPLAGLFCGGEIGRCSSSLIEESNKERFAPCCHVFSTVYLVMSYTSACPDF
uniref:F-box domain-containing protein n=1 Tax=Fagus sylvatica TaxID=28930 RepID=A0A2N9EN35_FAGSY